MSDKPLVICGMGGSGLPARALTFLKPEWDVTVHSTYGLPPKGDVKYVAISYSGNTRETLSFAREALEEGKNLSVVTSGGKLLDMARENNIPHAVVESGVQPRDAFLTLLKGLLTVIDERVLLDELESINSDEEAISSEAEHLSEKYQDKIPLIYTSMDNKFLAYMWKIFINETAKIPSFINVLPELTHNELEAKRFSEMFKILILYTEEDDPRVMRQMEALKEVVGPDKVSSLPLPMEKLERLITSWYLARGFARSLAAYYKEDPDNVPTIEKFKQSL